MQRCLPIRNRFSLESFFEQFFVLEEEDVVKQLLGTFFPLFASHVEDAQRQLEAAFVPTLTTLANAPHSSPLSDVDHEAVIKFMIGLTLPTVAPAVIIF